MTTHTDTDIDSAEERVDTWGPGPLQMPDGLDAEQWIAESKALVADTLEEADR